MNIIINRGKVVELDDLPEYSIAIDGFVSGPAIDSVHHRFSLDHHGKTCLRFCTSSACMQAWCAIMLGLDACNYTLFCNHCDVDTCLAVYCLKNPDRCNEQLLRKLVESVNLADCHGSAIMMNGNSKLIEWIAAPEVDAVKSGDYERLSDDGLRNIMDAVMSRVDLYLSGEASIEIVKQHSHCDYKVISNENDWVMVESDDSHVYSALYHAGFDRVVTYHYQKDGSIAYSIARRSDFISNFNVLEIFAQLNKLEPGWGGGSTIGGAPRNPDGSRSRLTPDQVREVVNNCVLEKYKVKSTRKKAAKK